MSGVRAANGVERSDCRKGTGKDPSARWRSLRMKGEGGLWKNDGRRNEAHIEAKRSEATAATGAHAIRLPAELHPSRSRAREVLKPYGFKRPFW